MHYDILRQLTHDRCERLQREAEAQRLALKVRGQRPHGKRRALRAKRQLAT